MLRQTHNTTVAQRLSTLQPQSVLWSQHVCLSQQQSSCRGTAHMLSGTTDWLFLLQMTKLFDLLTLTLIQQICIKVAKKQLLKHNTVKP